MSAFDDWLKDTMAPATNTPRISVYSANDKAIASVAFNAGMERAAEILENHPFMVGTQEQLMPQINNVCRAIRKEIES